MPVNHVLLETIELTQSAASVTFDNIPQTGYSGLKIVMSARGDGATGTFICQFNGATTNLSSRILYGINGNTAGSASYSDENSIWGYTTNSGSTANTFNNAEILIPNYTSSNNKSVSIDAVNETNAADGRQNLTAGLWSSSAAITSITLLSKTGSNVATNFTQYSTFSIYGIAATGTTPVTAPKAQGGNIVANDGTYWYHAFLSSGTFTPTVALTADALVVAGGGGGGSRWGGGGGAGGLRCLLSQSLTSTQYSVIIGSSGSGGSSSGYNSGTNGTNSSFNSISSTGGGGGGSNAVGLSGGSGGGGGTGGSSNSRAGGSGNAGSYSPVEGFAGGLTPNLAYQGAGGGGAGSVGSNAPAQQRGGAGGAGANSYNSITFTSWLTATSTGVSGYLAGGGGGGGETANGGVSGGAGGTGGGGRGGNQNEASGVAATINTGGGGGGGANDASAGAAGGSGIVIIRYAMA